MKLWITVFALTVFVAGYAQSQPDFSSAKAIIQDHIDKHHLPSATIAVVKDGKIIWEEGFGYADKENKRKATPATPYCLASVSKTMTATAIMRLAEQGMLNLEISVRRHGCN